MIPVSDRFLAAVAGSHEAAIYAEVLSDQDDPIPLQVLDGGITIAAFDTIRHEARVEVRDPSGAFAADDLLDIMRAYATRIGLYRGVKYADGTIEAPRRATIYPTEVRADEDDGGVVIEITGFDAACRCQDPSTKPISLANGTSVNTAIATVLTEAFRQLSFDLEESAATIPATLIAEDSDLWDEATKIALSAGLSLYVDRLDTVRTTSIPRFANFVRASFTEGPGSKFWEPRRSSSADDVPNVIVCIGTHSSYPNVRAEAADMDASSPTYRYGTYGEHTRTFKSALLTSNTQAQQMANGILVQLLGPSDELEMSIIPNPALDVLDAIEITRARLGVVAQPRLITEMEIPLTVDERMRVTARPSVFLAPGET